MKKKFIAILIAAFVVMGYFVSSCDEEAKEESKVANETSVTVTEDTVMEHDDENAPKNTDPSTIKRTAKGKDKLVDENEFYKVFIRRDEYDSISFNQYLYCRKNEKTILFVKIVQKCKILNFVITKELIPSDIANLIYLSFKAIDVIFKYSFARFVILSVNFQSRIGNKYISCIFMWVIVLSNV